GETPFTSVVSTAWLTPPPGPFTDQFTITFGTGTPAWLVTVTATGMVERTVSVTVVGVGPLAAIVIAPLISEKAVNVTGEPFSPARAPVAICAPAFGPRVRVAVATPFACVATASPKLSAPKPRFGGHVPALVYN